MRFLTTMAPTRRRPFASLTQVSDRSRQHVEAIGQTGNTDGPREKDKDCADEEGFMFHLNALIAKAAYYTQGASCLYVI